MTGGKYERYQDYVIRDGRLIGEFEELYRDFADPWEQTAHEADALDKLIGVALLKRNGCNRPLEYGCGLGVYTAVLQRELGNACGVDVSATAIANAKQRHAGTEFFVADILDEMPLASFQPDALVLAEITWYVLERLPAFKSLISRTMKGRGFLHLLTVYPPDQQRYGREYFTNLNEIRQFWSDVIDIQEWGEVARTVGNGVRRSFFYGVIR